MPDFIEPQLCQSRRAAAGRRGLGARDQVRRLPHAAAGRGRRGDAAHPQGPGLDRQVSARSPRPARACPTASSTARSWRSNDDGAPDFAALQAALSDGKTDDLVFFAFDLLFDGGEDLRALPLSRAQGAAAGAARRAGEPRRASATSSISRPAATRCCSRPAACRSKASSPSGSTRPTAPAARESWTKAKCRAGHEVVIGGWTDDGRRSSARCSSACIAAASSSMSAGSAPASAQARSSALLPRAEGRRAADAVAVHRRTARRASEADVHWVAARPGGRDRVRRLDRRRHGAPGRLQGPARGQAGRGGRGRRRPRPPSDDRRSPKPADRPQRAKPPRRGKPS